MKQYEYKLSFLPEAINDCEKVSDLETTCEVKGKYPCPCCCYNTFLFLKKMPSLIYVLYVFWRMMFLQQAMMSPVMKTEE